MDKIKEEMRAQSTALASTVSSSIKECFEPLKSLIPKKRSMPSDEGDDIPTLLVELLDGSASAHDAPVRLGRSAPPLLGQAEFPLAALGAHNRGPIDVEKELADPDGRVDQAHLHTRLQEMAQRASAVSPAASAASAPASAAARHG